MAKTLKDLTTLQIGGPVKKVVTVTTDSELISTITSETDQRNLIVFLGSGSNILASDEGSDSVVIKNEIKGITQSDTILKVKSGTLLQDLVDYANQNNLAGLEKLAGIPGTVGGAVYGNAGAYGQSISDHLLSVTWYNRIKKETLTSSKDDCLFGYRDSRFKHSKSNAYYFTDEYILEIELQLTPGNSEELTQESAEIIKKRQEKYPPGIKCPGSFFKNVIAENLSKDILEKIPAEKVVYGKIPAGTLLEMVGAKGAKLGQIEIADYHANLFINLDNGTSKDFWNLAFEYSQKVFDKFGIRLDVEVQFINLQPLS
jgi:UDP-N-acetylmuramate dehydrogenase